MSKIKQRISMIFLVIISFIMSGCGVSVPKDIQPVSNFEVDKYLGQWYEIARIDNWFEEDMINVYANYSLQEDGSIKVVNRGYNSDKQAWKESIGKAYLIDEPNMAALKVSFFGPFYGGYNIVKLDDDYQVALVVGSSKKYLWILARTPCISDEIKNAYIQKAQDIGYDVSKINFNIQSSCTVK